jgi:hypothetical protein
MITIAISKAFSDAEREVLEKQVMYALDHFNELQVLNSLRVDKIRQGDHVLGRANYSKGMDARISLQYPASMHTIGHELTHIARHKKLIDIPASEFATDVFTTARNDLFNDNPCVYVEYSSEIFKWSPKVHRMLMMVGVMYYQKYGKIKWCNELKKDVQIIMNHVRAGHDPETFMEMAKNG